jgi:hypothetical protein
MSTSLKKRTYTLEQLALFTTQQAGSQIGSALVFDSGDHIAAITNRAGIADVAKGARSTSDGNLEVHFVNDWDASGNAVWSIIKLVANDPVKAGIFDYVRSTGTTVDIANVEFVL